MTKMKYLEWAEAFTIFSKYEDDRASIAAEHNVIYTGHNMVDISMEEKDLNRLIELNWHYDERLECWFHYV